MQGHLLHCLYLLRVQVQGTGFRVQGTGFRVQGTGCRVKGRGFRVQGSGYRAQGHLLHAAVLSEACLLHLPPHEELHVIPRLESTAKLLEKSRPPISASGCGVTSSFTSRDGGVVTSSVTSHCPPHEQLHAIPTLPSTAKLS